MTQVNVRDIPLPIGHLDSLCVVTDAGYTTLSTVGDAVDNKLEPRHVKAVTPESVNAYFRRSSTSTGDAHANVGFDTRDMVNLFAWLKRLGAYPYETLEAV